MTPSERERTDACWCDDRTLSVCNDDCARIRELPLLRERAELAEAAAKDFRDLLQRLSGWDMLYAGPPPVTGDAPYWQGEIAGVLAAHPSFSGEEGTER